MHRILSLMIAPRFCLAVYLASWLGCAARSAPSGDAAVGAAADGGRAQMCDQCDQGQTCVVYCARGAPTQGCHTPETTAVALGETCESGKTCREGICAAGAGISPARCVPFCARDTDCAAADRCQTRDVTYTCESGATKLRLSVCVPRS